ncbi:MAG TPA: NUDIX domain-containing protein [Chloroflexi bacterium]|jgi:8-oxo-dGTP diphosphatase|nr:NUDIX domain-containing protein [Chloroflexota bacterium]
MGFDDTYRLSVHAVILNKAGQVLQLKATYGGGGWGLPGGCLDPGETVHEALLRECREELGCAVEIDYMSGIYYHRAYNSHACIFACTLPADAEIRTSAEHSEYRYFDLDELSAVQRRRVQDCLEFDGQVRSAAF